MRNKSLFLLVACVCGTIAAIGVSQWMQAQDKGPGGRTVEILVAALDIDKGEEITAEKMKLENWPEGKAPPGATSDVDAVLGKYAVTRFYAGEALMPVKLTDNSYKVIPRGYTVVDMPARDIGIAHVLQPGDRVNVMAYFTKNDLIPRSMTKTVLMGVRVFALDGDSERKLGEDRPKNVRSIQLLIHKDDAVAWTYANELGKIRMAVGNDDDYKANTADDGSNLAAKDFVTWLDDHRRAQEEREKAEAVEEPAPTVARAEPAQARSRNGFEMLKYGQDGRLYKYWIEPGKLPQIIEFMDPESSNGGASGSAAPAGEPSEAPLSPVDDRDEDYSYLNGEDSPFYQPPPGSDRPRSEPGQ